MSDIFREVDEEVRREQFTALWKRFGPFIIALAVVIVLGVAGWRAWEWYQARRATEIGQNYFAALQLANDGEHQQAAQAFAELADTGEAYGTLAALRHASELAQAGDTQGAIAAYDAIAKDASVSRLLRGLAQIRAGYLQVDTADPAKLRQQMEGYLSDDSNPWRNAAREIQGLAAYRAGDYEAASALFEQILGDPEAPQDMLQRAQMMFTLLAAGAPDAMTASQPAEQPATPVATGTPSVPSEIPQVPPAATAPAAPEAAPASPAQPAPAAPEAAPAQPDASTTQPDTSAAQPDAAAPQAEPAPQAAPAPAAETQQPAPTDTSAPTEPSAAGTNEDSK